MKRGRSLVQEENEIFQVGEWLGVIYTVTGTLMTLVTPGSWGRLSKKQRNRYDIHIKSSHDLIGFTSRNPSRMNSGFAHVRIQIQM